MSGELNIYIIRLTTVTNKVLTIAYEEKALLMIHYTRTLITITDIVMQQSNWKNPRNKKAVKRQGI